MIGSKLASDSSDFASFPNFAPIIEYLEKLLLSLLLALNLLLFYILYGNLVKYF